MRYSEKTQAIHPLNITPITISSIIKDIVLFVTEEKETFQNKLNGSQSYIPNKKKNSKKFIPLILLMVVVFGVVLFSARTLAATTEKTNATDRPEVKNALAIAALNKEISVPLRDSTGKEITKIKYIIENAELRDEIIVKGSKATAVKGRVFLIINIKIANDYDKAVQINARDYIRLSVNGNNQELLAADIHNDPVSVQPISTKTTRLGFPMNESDTNLLLKVGEIKGEKEDIVLDLK